MSGVGTHKWVGRYMRGMCMHTAPGTRAGCAASHRGMHTFKDLGLVWTHECPTIVIFRPVNDDEPGIIHRF